MQSKGLSGVFSNTTVQKHQFFGAQFSSQSNSHPYLTTGKTIALTKRTFVGKVMSLLFNVLSRYDLNQILYDYTVEVRNRFKGLDLIDRVPDELWTEVLDIVQKRSSQPRLHKRPYIKGL